MELDKLFLHSEVCEMMRSEIHPAEYNPRKWDDESRKALKRSIKSFGVLGGIIVNKQTGYTIVGGHYKVDILDEMNKYNPETKENDYKLRVDVIDVDLKREKTINTALNNANLTGRWDFDKLRALVPDIDPKEAGLSQADLSMIGMDFLFKTEKENELSNQLDGMMQPVDEQKRKEREERQRQEISDAQAEANAQQAAEDDRQARIDHMRGVKQQVKDKAISGAMDSDAYIMLSFDTWENKEKFCEFLGLDPYNKFVKGEFIMNLLAPDDEGVPGDETDNE